MEQKIKVVVTIFTVAGFAVLAVIIFVVAKYKRDEADIETKYIDPNDALPETSSQMRVDKVHLISSQEDIPDQGSSEKPPKVSEPKLLKKIPEDKKTSDNDLKKTTPRQESITGNQNGEQTLPQNGQVSIGEDDKKVVKNDDKKDVKEDKKEEIKDVKKSVKNDDKKDVKEDKKEEIKDAKKSVKNDDKKDVKEDKKEEIKDAKKSVKNDDKKDIEDDKKDNGKKDDKPKQLSPADEKLQYYEKLVQASVKFEKDHRKYEVRNNLITEIVKRSKDQQATKIRIAEQAQNTRILMDDRAMKLAIAFLAHKKLHGNKVEKSVYKSMKDFEFVDRLLRKRPLMFMKEVDRTVLRNSPSMEPTNMHSKWLLVGTESEDPELPLQNYLSYEEMEIAALLCVSVPTFFINNGRRDRKGQLDKEGTFVNEGIFIAAVGARFPVPHLMEGRHMITPNSKAVISHSELMNLWKVLYRGSGNLPEDLFRGIRAADGSVIYLNSVAYKIRMELILKPIIYHAEAEGKARGKKVVLRLTGFGLSLWAFDKAIQTEIFISAVKELLAKGSFDYITLVELQYFDTKEKGTSISCTNGKNIELNLTNTQAASPLPSGKADHLLVATYAWDGNSFPGNEYWGGSKYLGSSGDSAAAACSTIQELQNPYVNEDLLAKDRLVTY